MGFIEVDVSTPDGQQAFTSAGLVGHPAFLILKSDGTELWRAVGQQNEKVLSDAVESALKTAGAP